MAAIDLDEHISFPGREQAISTWLVVCAAETTQFHRLAAGTWSVAGSGEARAEAESVAACGFAGDSPPAPAQPAHYM